MIFKSRLQTSHVQNEINFSEHHFIISQCTDTKGYWFSVCVVFELVREEETPITFCGVTYSLLEGRLLRLFDSVPSGRDFK